MQELSLLRDLLILVAVAIPAVALTTRLKISPIVAFLFTGMAIGPYGLRLISGPESVAALAELGVVLLLFEIGLEVSLSRIIKLGSVVTLGGAAQVLTTIAVVALVAILFNVPTNRALVFGGLIALSSTAIVLKALQDHGELDTPHGRVVLAILLFQDLAIVPLMLFVPLLAQTAESSVVQSLLDVGQGVIVMAALVAGGRLVVPWVLERVVGLKNRELFTLTVGFFGLGTAFVAAQFGLSLALGAFVAGLIIAESEYGVQALSDVLPFRTLFSGIFFTSVGMLLDLGFVVAQPVFLGGIALAVIVGKTVIITVIVVLALRRSVFTGLLSGLSLAQVGEFSFVLAGVASLQGLLDENAYQVFLAASILSMLATPFLIASSRPIAERFARMVGRSSAEIGADGKAHTGELSDHAIIVGFGLSGRHLARVLKAAHVPYLVLEMNGQLVRKARHERVPIFFGDGSRREVLLSAGIERARVVIFNISSPTDERKGVGIARELNPAVKIIVRTRYVAALEDLARLGAGEVIVEEFEAALEMFQRVLDHYRIPSNTIQRELDAMRSEHYGVLRGVPTKELHLDELKYLGIHHALELVEVEEGARAIGENPVSLNLRHETGAMVICVVRDSVALYTPDPEFRFRAGDAVVLVGDAPAIEKGAQAFRNMAESAVLSRSADHT